VITRRRSAGADNRTWMSEMREVAIAVAAAHLNLSGWLGAAQAERVHPRRGWVGTTSRIDDRPDTRDAGQFC